VSARLALATLATALVVSGSAVASTVLAPQTIDAGTGADAYEVGVAIGHNEAWAAFVQHTDGHARLYVAHARNKVFGPPALADDANLAAAGAPVTGAALAGSASGGAVVTYGVTDAAGHSEIFARRLTDGDIGDEASITPTGASGKLPQLTLGVHHRRVLAENDAGVAALCYIDPATNDAYAAVAAAGSNTWTRYGPLMSTTCEDIGVDARGDVIVIGEDANMRAATNRIIGGVLHSEEIDPDAMDEESLALSSNGAALVFARTTTGTDFAGSAWLLPDIAVGGPWQSLGAIDGSVRQPGDNTEYVRGALAANGQGIVTFRVNDPAAGTSALFWLRVSTTASSPLAPPQELAEADVGADAIPQVDARGNGVVLYDKRANETPVPVVLTPAAQSSVELATGANGSFCVPCFQEDTAGDFLSLIRKGVDPQRVAAVFGSPEVAVGPKPALRVAPHKVRRGRTATLVGSGFGPRARVALFLVPAHSDVRLPFARTRANSNGAFRYRLRILVNARRGRYGVLACQGACRIKASATLSVR
jgi:hypothetical protein